MSFLNRREKQTLASICDTLFPSLTAHGDDDPALFSLSAAQVELPERLEQALEDATDANAKLAIRGFLRLLENRAANASAGRGFKAFYGMSLEERTTVLRAWADSDLAPARQIFQGLKRLGMFIAYAAMPQGEPNPTWPSLRYPGPPAKQSDQPKRIEALNITQDQSLEADVIIIGSGAGGGVIAGELSAAGYSVLILEKGGYYAEADFNGRELQSSSLLYEKAAALATVDASMVIVAGSTLGGGTTVNWMSSLRTPAEVLHEWEHEYGFTGATSASFQSSMDAVCSRLNVNSDFSQPNAQNQALERGAAALGYTVQPIPRNAKNCEDCSFCNFGCSLGAKQSTLNTYLQDAYERGACFVVGAHVQRVTHEGGRVTGAIAEVVNAAGRRFTLTLKSKAVVVAAGSIHTPAILLRSGLENKQIGQNLHLHPVTVSVGEYAEPIHPWQGAPQTRIITQFTDLDGKGYGVRIETAPAHPGILAGSLAWQSGRQHRRLMGRSAHFSLFIILTRDRYGGKVTLAKDGSPVLHYRLHRYDSKHMMRGLLESMRLHRAADAQIIYSPHNQFIPYHATSGGNFEAYLNRVQNVGFKPNAYALFSAHQLSSCRIAGDAKRGAVKPNGESYELQNLFVADASVLPTASGVNPMISIMSTAHFIAQHIKAQV